MSKYVTSKHGIVLGYANLFVDIPQGRGGRAIVWCEGYKPEQINSVNYCLRTAAHQIMYDVKVVPVPAVQTTLFESTSKSMFIPSQFAEMKLRNVNWFFASPNFDGYDYSPTFFFERVSDARMFRDGLEYHLRGVKG